MDATQVDDFTSQPEGSPEKPKSFGIPIVDPVTSRVIGAKLGGQTFILLYVLFYCGTCI